MEFNYDRENTLLQFRKGGGFIESTAVGVDCSIAIPAKDEWYTMSNIVENGDEFYPFFTAESTLKVSSSDANDTSAGTGARTITIEGVDENYNEVTEVVTLNGQTPVTTTNSFFRLNNFSITTIGSNKINHGDIWIYGSSESSVTAGVPQTFTYKQGKLEAGTGLRQHGMYTIPADKQGWIIQRFINTQEPVTGTPPEAAKVRHIRHQVIDNDKDDPGPDDYSIALITPTTGNTFIVRDEVLKATSLDSGTTLEIQGCTTENDLTIYTRYELLLANKDDLT